MGYRGALTDKHEGRAQSGRQSQEDKRQQGVNEDVRRQDRRVGAYD